MVSAAPRVVAVAADMTLMTIGVEVARATVVVGTIAIALATMVAAVVAAAAVSDLTIEAPAMGRTELIVRQDMEEEEEEEEDDEMIMAPEALIAMHLRAVKNVTDREMITVLAIILRARVEVRVATETPLQETHMDPETVIIPKMIGTPVVESVD